MFEPCPLRVRPDFNYTPQEWVEISVAPGYAGFVVLMPGRTVADQSVLNLVAEVHGTSNAASIRYKPLGDGLQIIDVPPSEGILPASGQGLHAQIEQLLASTPDKGLDPKPPVIKVQP